MAPQQQDTQSAGTSTTASSIAEKSESVTKHKPIKNALNDEVEHFEFDHPELRSVFPTTKHDPIPVLQYEDRGLMADPTFKNLLKDASVTHLSPRIGTELSGIQLHQLTNAQRDELALLVSHRGVVFFRDQEINIEQQLDLGRTYLFFGIPAYEAYERLTPPFKTFIEGLTAIHSNKAQAERAERRGHTIRRAPVEFEHPVVRTHPVTGRKALFVNPAFTRRIPQLSSRESDVVLKVLYKHITEGHEFQVRFRWTKNAVAVWDNRITTHFATFDYLPGNRHAVRVTTQGEIPYLDGEASRP
ncbi:hypothetical protein PInf_009542 [Phytophthora infestans]|nr:hypothetical protein PInf_009542 [Phytophthora infestans]